MAERGLKALENWAKRVTDGYNGVQVKDMSSSFRDGLAFCAIIHHYYPDLIDFESLSKENVLHNNSLAFSTAEKQLGVPALLDAEDMVSCKVPDRLSIITYLSQLHNCFENQNKVNRLRPAVKRILKDDQSGFPYKVPLSDQKNSRTYELCQTCKHRVYILERLMVAGKLYHRTCFRCCKCNSLLKPGAYIESDLPNSFECSVCPQDEKIRTEVNEPVKPSVTLRVSPDHSPSVSPLSSPKLPHYSSTFNSARNCFLQKSIHLDDDVGEHDTSVSANSSLSELSSMSLEATTEGTQPSSLEGNELESLKKPELSSSKSSNDSSYESALEKDFSSSRKPYQSVFTREISSLKPLPRVRTSLASKQPSIPVIRSTSYISPLSLPRPSSVSNFHLKSSHEETNQRHRRGSLDASAMTDSDISNECAKLDKEISHSEDDSDSNAQNHILGSSVKELIRKREESIRHAKDSVVPIPTIRHKKMQSESSIDMSLQKSENSIDTLDNETSNDSFVTVKCVSSENEDKWFEDKTMNNKDKNLPDEEISPIQNEIIDEKAKEEKLPDKTSPTIEVEDTSPKSVDNELYPDDLNPFGDDEPEDEPKSASNCESYPTVLNPFGDFDEEETNENKNDYDESKNPFADEDDDESVAPPAYKPPPVPAVRTSLITSSPKQKSVDHSPTGSIRGTLKKRAAPKPPHVQDVFQNGSANSSPKSLQSSPVINSPPKARKTKKAPPPPSPLTPNKNSSQNDHRRLSSESNTSTPSKNSDAGDHAAKKKKRPAPPVPIPPRRQIKKIPLKDIQKELNDIEEKQMDLEKQGRDLEELIRDRDKDEEPTVEEEEYIMQLFELVNQKNALFRRQAELVHIKRSQRLEEEQVELEFQIRCLLSKPASQKTEEDKEKEEKLVQQLLDVVDQRNEIIDSIEMDRKREAEEDISVQEQMEIKISDLPITAEIQEHKKEKKKKKKDKKKDKEEKEKKGTLKKKFLKF